MSVLLPVQDITGTGAVPTFHSAAAAGNHFTNDGRVNIEFVNGHTAPIDITILSVAACNQGFTHNLTFTVAAGARRRMPTLDPGRFNNAAGHTSITYTLVTALTVGVFRQ